MPLLRYFSTYHSLYGEWFGMEEVSLDVLGNDEFSITIHHWVPIRPLLPQGPRP